MNLQPAQCFNFLPIPTDVHFGFGASRSLPTHVRVAGGRKVFVVTDPGVRRTGIVDGIVSLLDQESIDFVVYDQVAADSGSALIRDAVEQLKSSNADVVVGIGGGSALDTAKAVGRGARDESRFSPRLRRPAQGAHSSSSHDRDPDDSRYWQRGLVVGRVHRRRP
jgi:alcohol dehydrogenase class IV